MSHAYGIGLHNKTESCYHRAILADAQDIQSNGQRYQNIIISLMLYALQANEQQVVRWRMTMSGFRKALCCVRGKGTYEVSD